VSQRAQNLLVIMSDQHQWNAMSGVDHPVVQTPNLDQLAASGVRFNNAYTPCPICVPARAAFATGRYVHDIRRWDNAMPYTGEPRGWGHALAAHGVRVESIGKLHYRSVEDDVGFDVQHIPMHVYENVGMVWASIRRESDRVYYKQVRMMGDYVGPGESDYTHYDQAVTDRTCQWLEDQTDAKQPWCLYVGLVAPHHPLVAPQRFFDLYPLDQLPPNKLHPMDGYRQHPWIVKTANAMVGEEGWQDEAERATAIAAYYGLVSWMDDNVGRMVSTLTDLGLRDDTTVIYTSDHGENLGVRGLWGKMNMYQESAAIPLIIAPPPQLDTTAASGAGEVSRSCDTPVSLLDLSETILDHFGAELPGQRPGESLYRIASNPECAERVVFSEYHAVGAVSAAFMVRRGRWKLIEYVGFEPELFDLQNDPQETRDLAQDPAHATMLQAMRAALAEICDPQAINALAFADQDAMIDGYGGRDVAATLGAPSATPPPKV
jgi:choline-sulfatase